MPGSWADYLVTVYTFLRNVPQIWHRRWMHFPRPLALDKCFSACNSEKSSCHTLDHSSFPLISLVKQCAVA